MVVTVSTRRTVGYLRVSSTGQTGERHSSLETQEARFREHCTRTGDIPIKTFIDVVSGRRDDRREYLRMVDFVMDGGADVVVVQFLDRFGRNPREILSRFWMLQDHGVEVIATDEDIKEELLLLIKAGIAGQESRRTSERVRANMARAIQKGVHAARAPYGLRRVYEGKDAVRWELDPVEAPVVREMYRLAVDQNMGYKALADRLTEQGHLAREGRPFASYTVQKILSNEALAGTLTYGKKPRKGNPETEVVRVEDFFPAILTGEEWEHLQERIGIRKGASRGRTHASEYLLSGIVRCGYCGGSMSGKVGAKKKDGTRYRNYWCTAAIRSKGACAHPNGHSASRLEKAVLEYLGQFSDPDLVTEHMAAAGKRELEQRETELAEITRGLADLDSQFQKRLDLLTRGIINESEFQKANEGIRSQRAAMEARKAELAKWVTEQKDRVSAAQEMPVKIGSFIEDFENLEVRVAKARLQSILKAIRVTREGLEIEFRG